MTQFLYNIIWIQYLVLFKKKKKKKKEKEVPFEIPSHSFKEK